MPYQGSGRVSEQAKRAFHGPGTPGRRSLVAPPPLIKFYPVYLKGWRSSSLVYMRPGGARLWGCRRLDKRHENTMPRRVEAVSDNTSVNIAG